MSSSPPVDLEHLDYYAILGLTREATQVEVRRAYKTLALQWHPDKHGGNDERFKKIAAAYQVLSDQSARKEYDLALDEAQRQQQQRSNPRYPQQQQQQQQYPLFGQQYDPFAAMRTMGGGMPDPFAHFHFAFRAADDVFRSVFGPDFAGFASASTGHAHPSSPFDSMFAPMPMMMPSMPFPPLPPLMGPLPFGPPPPPPPHHALLHHHHHLFHHAMPAAGSASAIAMSSSSRGTGGGFTSTSTTRTVDHAGNVIEETVTVDASGHRTAVRKVNGVEQPVTNATAAVHGPYEVPVITASGGSASQRRLPPAPSAQYPQHHGHQYQQPQQSVAHGANHEARRYRRE